MNRDKRSSKKIEKRDKSKDDKNIMEKKEDEMEANRKQLLDSISKLSYADAIAELDRILLKLQDDQIPVEEIQANHLSAKVYLQHCNELLNRVEQEVIYFSDTID